MHKRNNRRNRNHNVALKERIPPSVIPRPVCQRKVRFFATNTLTAVPITSLCFFRLLGLTVNGTTGLHYIAAAYRLRSLKVYSSVVGSSFATISVEWFSTYNRNMEITDTGTSTYPAFIKTHPPPDSDAGNWLSTDSDLYNNVLFTISAPIGAVIDVSFDYVLGDGANTFASGVLSAAATFTGPVIMKLDNITSAGATGGQLISPLVNATANFV